MHQTLELFALSNQLIDSFSDIVSFNPHYLHRVPGVFAHLLDQMCKNLRVTGTGVDGQLDLVTAEIRNGRLKAINENSPQTSHPSHAPQATSWWMRQSFCCSEPYRRHELSSSFLRASRP